MTQIDIQNQDETVTERPVGENAEKRKSDVKEDEKPKIFKGRFIWSKSRTELKIIHDGAIGVDKIGKIAFISEDGSVPSDSQWKDVEDVQANDEDRFFFPGQFPNLGIFGKSTLLDWLNRYTFPLEASLADEKKADDVYTSCVRRTISHGTTTAAYYATIDPKTTTILAKKCLQMGQRAFVGRVCMDHPETCPNYYRDESAVAGEVATRACIAEMEKLDPKRELVSPIITPRFAPSSTKDSLRRLGELAKETGLPIQTHIAETKDELKLVKKMFPDSKSYADVYDEYGLLGPKTVLAHAVWLTPEEIELIKRRDAKISHCPVSNSALGSGFAPVRELLDAGITVGLGTDVSGGYCPSIHETMRHASLVSRNVALTRDNDDAKLSVEECLYLGTRGGAEVLGIGDKVGAFEVGMEFDAQLICLRNDHSVIDFFGDESWDELLAKWVFCGNYMNTKGVWVKGRCIDRRIDR